MDNNHLDDPHTKANLLFQVIYFPNFVVHNHAWTSKFMIVSIIYNARLPLLQAHFSQLALPISDYNTDLKSVLDQSIRILQAMIDICANSGWLTSSLTCMRLLQMVMQVLSWKITPLISFRRMLLLDPFLSLIAGHVVRSRFVIMDDFMHERWPSGISNRKRNPHAASAIRTSKGNSKKYNRKLPCIQIISGTNPLSNWSHLFLFHGLVWLFYILSGLN